MNIIRKIIFVALICFYLPSLIAMHSHTANARVVTGNEIFALCNPKNDEVSQTFCLAYTTGLLEGIILGVTTVFIIVSTADEISRNEFDAIVDSVLKFCIPESADEIQLKDAFYQYLDQNPSERHNSARALLLKAYQTAFPCHAR